MLRVGNTILNTTERADCSILISSLARQSGNLNYRGTYTWVESGVEALVAAVVKNYCTGKSNYETISYASGSIVIEVSVKTLSTVSSEMIERSINAVNEGVDLSNFTDIILQLKTSVESLSKLIVNL